MITRLLVAMLVCVGVTNARAQAANPLAWPAVSKQLQEHWKTTYSTEKVLKIEPKGSIQYYATERRTEIDASWGWIWDSRVIETQGTFARQVALVTIERANKTQARFEVAALFMRADNAWRFRTFAVGNVEDLTAAKAGDLPSAASAAAIFKASWAKARPDFDVQSVEVLKSEPRQHQEKRWITYNLAITAVGTDKGSRDMYNKKYRCTPADYSSVLNYEGGTWVADEKMITNVNEARDCTLAR